MFSSFSFSRRPILLCNPFSGSSVSSVKVWIFPQIGRIHLKNSIREQNTLRRKKKHTDSPSYQLEYHLNVESADAEPNPGSTSTHTKSLRYNKETIKQTLQKKVSPKSHPLQFVSRLYNLPFRQPISAQHNFSATYLMKYMINFFALNWFN